MFDVLRDITVELMTSQVRSGQVLLGRERFSSITYDQIEIESRERHHCTGTELTN